VVLVIHGAGWAGTERHVRTLVRGLTRRGRQVDLVVSEDGPLAEEARAIGAGVQIVPRPDPAGYVLALRRWLRAERPAIVHAHSGRLACLAARWAGVPAILETRHGIPERLRPLYRIVPAARSWEGWKCRLAHRTLTVCEADARWLVGAGLSAANVRVVRNGLPAPPGDREEGNRPSEDAAKARSRWGLPREAVLVGFVGRLAPQKAPERFLETLAPLLTSREESGGATPPSGALRSGGAAGATRFGVVCGSGPEERRLRGLARRLGIEDRLLWLGAHADARPLIPALDLLLLPSRWEGLPYVLLDAMEAGVPALCTPVGGVPELLCGDELGEMCLAWNAREWTERARRMLVQPAARAAWAQAARGKVRGLTEEAMLDQLEAVYAEVLG
jgi:glycosyltransferase involved in cell wall biosynthesis